MPTIPKEDIKRRELSYKASKDVLKANNLFPSPQYAHNIYNDNRQQQHIEISQTISKMIGHSMLEELETLANDGVD